MSGWSEADKMMEEDMPFDFPAVNNITIAGYLPHDKVPQSSKYNTNTLRVLRVILQNCCTAILMRMHQSPIMNNLIVNSFVNSEKQDFH